VTVYGIQVFTFGDRDRIWILRSDLENVILARDRWPAGRCMPPEWSQQRRAKKQFKTNESLCGVPITSIQENLQMGQLALTAFLRLLAGGGSLPFGPHFLPSGAKPTTKKCCVRHRNSVLLISS